MVKLFTQIIRKYYLEINDLRKSKSIDPEVIPPYSNARSNAVRSIPRWLVYGVIGLGVLITVGILKALFPLIVMGLLLGFIWKQVHTN